jgi:hypothetical protein
MSDILDQDDEKILLEKLRLENKLLRRVISVIMLFIIIVELFYIWGE